MLYWEPAASGGDALSALFRGATWDPNVGILVQGAPGPPPREHIDLKAIDDLAASALAIVIGVWDGEGLLFWQDAT